MTTAHRIDVYRHARAPLATVWEVLSDHGAMSRWTRIPSASLEREGDPPPNGVGAIRRLGAGPVVSREEVLLFEPPTRMSYTILSGVPVRGYRADVTLTATSDGGTDVRWQAGFESGPPLLGGVLRAFLDGAIRQLASSLKREAERRSA